MFSANVFITSLSELETVTFSDKTLLVRWLFGTVNEKNVAFKLWNDLANHTQLSLNNEVQVEFKIESREHKGRYFTDLTITKIL
ncbi:DUF3127 domain-containing protein [Larkinella sp. GY13]|uniref:DUF3127 domain-containing protein n=1 Tax=Larkinella sp. GY13 TaxID=3453720 RepID=UPI003EE8F5B1